MKNKTKIIICGRVQGVGFRKYTKRIAEHFSIQGNVMNLTNGDVEVNIIQDNQYQYFINKLKRGSLLSRVEKIEIIDYQDNKDFFGFEIIRDFHFIKDQIMSFINLLKSLSPFHRLNINKLSDLHIRHLTIIPDGNRRLARDNNVYTFKGHNIGVKQLIGLLSFIIDNHLNINYITAWGFSSDNWKRSQEEVSYLMELFKRTMIEYGPLFIQKEIRFRHIGRRDRLDKELLAIIDKLESDTKTFDKYNFSIIIDYDGRDEILNAINNIIIDKKDIRIDNFTEYLYTKDIPDTDLFIRTSGEMRSSGLFLWQGAYSEWYYTKKHFPNFDKYELYKALIDYKNRDRRFGR